MQSPGRELLQEFLQEEQPRGWVAEEEAGGVGLCQKAEPKGSEDTSNAAREGGAGEASKSISGLHLRQLPPLI